MLRPHFWRSGEYGDNLLLFPGSISPEKAVPVRVTFIGQIYQFKNYPCTIGILDT